MSEYSAEYRNNASALFALFLLVVVIVATLLACRFASAHDHKRPELDTWFESLKNSNGTLCCEGSEANRVEDVDWQSVCENNECHYQVFISKQWWDVPEWAIVKGPNQSGPTLVWPIYYWKDGKPENGLSSVFIRCFLPGAGG